MERFVSGFRLSGYGAAYFFASGAFMSYWPVWLRDRGITDSEIGTLFMSRQLVSVVSMLGIGFLAHRIGRLRGMLLALAVAAIVMMGVYQLSYTFVALLLIGLLWGCVWSPTMALYDGVLVNEARARGFVYGTLRVWGSVAFIAGTLICGVAVDHFGPPSVLYVGWLGVICLLPFALVLPRGEAHPRGADRHAPFGIFDLFRSRPFLLFMIGAGFCQSSHAVLYSFGTLTWRGAGIDDVTISMLWGESVAVEILTDDGERLADEADRRHRPDRPWPRLRHRALDRHGLHDRAAGADRAAARCTPAPSPPAISAPWPSSSAPCRAVAWRSAKASTTRWAPVRPRP